MTEEIMMTKRSRFWWAAISWTAALVVFLTATYVAYRRERARAEALGDREAAIMALINSASYGFVILDEDGRVREWNSAMERLSGFSRDEMLGHDVLGLMPPEKSHEHRVAFAKAVTDPGASKRVQFVDCLLQPKDKGKSPISVRVSVRVVRASRDGTNAPYAIAHVDRASRIVELPPEQPDGI